MTKIELMKMLENVNDNEELTFVKRGSNNYDLYGYDETVEVYKVIGGEVATLKDEHGMAEIEAVTDDMEFVESRKMICGEVINYYKRKQ